MQQLQSINPATGKVFAKTKQPSDKDLEASLSRAAEAAQKWAKTSYAQRSFLLKKVAAQLRKQKKQLAVLAASEMGKTVTAGELEIEKCAVTLEFYAENGSSLLSHEVVDTDAKKSYVRFDPLGVILAVMPWNFPYWQVFRFAAPALMAGNVGVLKHASNVQQSAAAIEQIFIAAGAPRGVFQNLAIESSRVERVVRDPRIAAIALTGSELAGSRVARVAGEELKKCVLELGGSDPFIVLKDADIELAATVAVAARMQNNCGQSCVAAKRFIVEKSVAKEFSALVVEKMKALIVGDPLAPATQVGPLASEQMVIGIDEQVRTSIRKGAKVLWGGERISSKGFFYMPTVLSSVKKGMPAYDEELFGPVLSIIEVPNEAAALRVANDTIYGLGATIFSKNIEKAEAMAGKIDAGNVFINAMVRSDVRLPFGGIKKSGYGRELSSYGIKEFVNIKTVFISR